MSNYRERSKNLCRERIIGTSKTRIMQATQKNERLKEENDILKSNGIPFKRSGELI